MSFEIRYDVKNFNWVLANQGKILSAGEPLYLDDGRYLFGDGVSPLSDLTFFGSRWGNIGGNPVDQSDLMALLESKQNSLGFTPEDSANKATSFATLNHSLFPTVQAVSTFVSAQINNLVSGAPGLLDTLYELAAALGNDPNFSATVTASLASKAPLESPAFSGTPTAPTASIGTNTTQIATTAFVNSAVSAGGALPSQTGNAGRFLRTDGSTAAWSSDIITDANRTAIKTVLGNNMALNVGGSGFVNYATNYGSGNFYSYQGYGNWEAIGSNAVGPSSLGTIIAIGGFRALQWQGITLHAAGSEMWRVGNNGSFSNTGSVGNAWIHLKAGTSSTAPLRFTSASLKSTNASAGDIQFLTDKLYLTITNGLAVKEFTLNDAALVNTAIPYVVNGRLTSSSNINADGTNMSIGAAVSNGYNGTVRGHYNSRPGSANGRGYVVEDAGVSTGIVAFEVRGYTSTTYQIASFGSGVAGNYSGTSIPIANSFAHFYQQSAYTTGIASAASGRAIHAALNHIFFSGINPTDAAVKLDSIGVRIANANALHTNNADALFTIGATGSSKAQFKFEISSAPGSLVNGTGWFDGADIWLVIGGVAKKFVLT